MGDSASKWQIRKEEPSDYRTFTVESLKLTKEVAEFEEGKKTSIQLADALIDALLLSDFNPNEGKHWSYDGTKVDPVTTTDENSQSFYCESSYIWDHKDIYAVAKAKGTITINGAEKLILIKGYNYYCAG
jgi:hypothetical protein